jgi:cytochrome P450
MADWYNRGPSGQLHSVIAERDPVEHKQRRRTWDRGFGTAAIKHYDEVVVRKTRQLLEQFEKRAGEEIDFSKWMTYFSYVLVSIFVVVRVCS